MFLSILQIFICSLILILLFHHLFLYFQQVFTVPKIKDLVQSPLHKYKNITDILEQRRIEETTTDLTTMIPNEYTNDYNDYNDFSSFPEEPWMKPSHQQQQQLYHQGQPHQLKKDLKQDLRKFLKSFHSKNQGNEEEEEDEPEQDEKEEMYDYTQKRQNSDQSYQYQYQNKNQYPDENEINYQETNQNSNQIGGNLYQEYMQSFSSSPSPEYNPFAF